MTGVSNEHSLRPPVKDATMLNVWSCILIYLLQSCSTRTGTFFDVRRLFQEKLKVNADRADLRPAYNQSTLIQTHVYLLIQNFEILDIENKLEINTLFYVYWIDDTASWDDLQYPVPYFYIKKQEFSVWTPTLMLKNSIGHKSYIGSLSHVLGQFFVNYGMVFMFGKQLFKSHCDIDMTYFPYDTQECSFEITSKPGEVVFSTGVCDMVNSNTLWSVLEVNSHYSNSSITCSIKAKRKPTFLIMNLIIPTVLIGFLNVFVFIVPANAGEKLQYSVSILLSFNVYLGILVDNVPANSENMSLLSYYIIYQYGFGVLAILCTAILLRTVHSNESKEIPKHFIEMVKIVRILICKRRCNRPLQGEDGGSNPNGSTPEIDRPVTWKSVCGAFDFVLFWLFLFFQIVGNLYFFLSLQ